MGADNGGKHSGDWSWGLIMGGIFWRLVMGADNGEKHFGDW